MWILKGILLGFAMFISGTVGFLLLTVFGPISTSKATGISAITGITTHNPLFWVALLACLMLGCALVGSWPASVRVP